jgi:hypothetical protein
MQRLIAPSVALALALTFVFAAGLTTAGKAVSCNGLKTCDQSPTAGHGRPTTSTTSTTTPTTTTTTTTTTTPQPVAPLAWRPPLLSNPITIDVSNSAAVFYLDSTRDYLVRMPATPLTVTGGLWIIGGHNVVIVGGEIAPGPPPPSPTPDKIYGLFLKNQTGTVHVEGLYMHGAGLGEGIVSDQAYGATVQIENCRIDITYPVPADGSIHPDVFQTWRGPYVLRIDRLTGFTTSKGLNLQPYEYDVQPLGTWDLRNLNLEANGSSYILWKNDLSRQTNNHVGYWTENHTNLYISPGRSWGWGWPDDAHWQAFSVGSPPGGDYVPPGVAGTSYKSPGYSG